MVQSVLIQQMVFINKSFFGLFVPRLSATLFERGVGFKFIQEERIQLMSTLCKTSDESEIDKTLRKFFSDDNPFGIAKQVMASFMVNYSADKDKGTTLSQNGAILSRLPLFDSGPIENEFSDLFQSIYEPINNSSDDNNGDLQVHKRRGQSFKLQIAYCGNDFCGWQIQPNNDIPSVQQTIIDRLNPILCTDDKKPIDVRVCGRTDAGVNAIGQYCRVRTLRSKDTVGPNEIMQAINNNNHESIDIDNSQQVPALLCTKAERVDDKFHPTFDALCRGYLYLIDYDPLMEVLRGLQRENSSVRMKDFISLLNSMLSKLEGKELDYFALSFGKVKTTTTCCTLSRCRAYLVETRDGQTAIGIELVGDRFLRRMVRILVATAVREVMLALQNATDTTGISSGEPLQCEESRLLTLVEGRDRMQSAKSAASHGLLFVGARFS